MTIFRSIYNQRSISLKFLQCISVPLRNMSQASLCIEPPSCLQDEPVHITCNGLKPHENISLTNEIKDDKGTRYFSLSQYRADENGHIDLNTFSSLGGDYQGVFPMGPFMTLESINTKRRFGFLKKDCTPLLCNFKVLAGHLEGEAPYQPATGSIIAEKEHLRHYLAPGVKEIKVHSGNIRGKLCIPPGDGPFPGVIDLYGTSGGLNPSRAGLLASRGIAALSLAYFRYEDLPPIPEELDIEYFKEAVDFLLAHDKVMKPHVGVIGLSKGSDVALAMGIYIDAVKSVIAVNGMTSNTWWPLRVGDLRIQETPYAMENLEYVEDDVVRTINVIDSYINNPEKCLPLEEADANFLFVAGKDDENWKSHESSLAGIKRLKKNDKQNWKLLSYEGAGHFINPPYSSLVKCSYHPLIKMYFSFGGNAKQQCQAQIHSWQETLKFFKNISSSKL